jgi:hypothetical protein
LATSGGDKIVQLLAVLSLACAVIVIWAAFFRSWSAINDGYARTTPGKAILFLLVPLVNLFWMFQAFAGYPTDYNLYLRRYQLSAPTLGRTWFILLCVVFLINTGLARLPEPLFQLIGILVTMAIGAIVLTKICKAVNRLPDGLHSVSPARTDLGPIGQFFNKLSALRLPRWALILVVAAGIIVILGIAADRIAQNQRVSRFKSAALETAEHYGPLLAAAIADSDHHLSGRPSRQLHELMKEILQRGFTYAILYMPVMSSEEFLWRYQGVGHYMSYEKDSPHITSWAGVKRVLVKNEMERAIHRALSGDNTSINEINRRSRATFHSVIVGKSGQPLAVLRLVIYGRGGTERDII